MSQLTKQMYQSASTPGLFGLTGGQMRGGTYIHNPGWYNGKGEFLGWGDLNVADLERIAREIDENEIFVVIDEEDWRKGYHPEVKERGAYQHVPVEFLARHAIFLVRRGKAYWRRAICSAVAGLLSSGGLLTRVSDTEQALSVMNGTFS